MPDAYLYLVVAPMRGFGGGSGDIVFDNTHCDGTEQRLEDCPHKGIDNHECDEDDVDDAGVICFPGELDIVQNP